MKAHRKEAYRTDAQRMGFASVAVGLCARPSSAIREAANPAMRVAHPVGNPVPLADTARAARRVSNSRHSRTARLESTERSHPHRDSYKRMVPPAGIEPAHMV
jgi:hypothetical protein